MVGEDWMSDVYTQTESTVSDLHVGPTSVFFAHALVWRSHTLSVTFAHAHRTLILTCIYAHVHTVRIKAARVSSLSLPWRILVIRLLVLATRLAHR